MPVTIKDVAKYCGLSISTVSNVINNKANVKDSNYQLVKQAIDELGYTPSMLARNLRQFKSKTIAIVVSAMDLVTSQIVDGIIEEISVKDYVCSLYITQHNPFIERKILSDLRLAGVAGIILQTCDNKNCDLIYSLMDNNTPVMLFDNYIETAEIPAVIFDNRKLTQRSLTNLKNRYAEMGQPLAPEDIVVITGGACYSNDADCLMGAREAMGAPLIHHAVSPLSEQAYCDLVRLFRDPQSLPRLFLTPRRTIASALRRLISAKHMDIPVLHLSGQEADGCTHDVCCIPRKTHRLGRNVARNMAQYLASPLFFEKTLEVMPSQEIFDEIIPPLPAHCSRLRLALFDGPTANALLPAIRDYQDHQGVEMQVELLSYEKLYDLIKESGREKQDHYDLFMLDLHWFDVLQNETYLYDFSALLREDDGFLKNFPPEIVEIYMENKGLFTVPLLVNMQYLFYRKDLFEDSDIRRTFFKQYGMELNLPRTWRDFEIIAQFFTRAFNPQSPVPFGTTLQGMQPINLSEEFFPRQWSYHGKLRSASGQIILDRAENIHALNSLKKTYACTPRQDISMDWKNEFNRMYNNELAMYYTFSTHLDMSLLRDNAHDTNGIGIATGFQSIPMLGGWNIAINHYSPHPGAAFHFIRWITGKSMAVNNTLTGCSIPHQTVFESDLCLRMQPWLSNFMESMRHARTREVLLNRKGQPIDTILIDDILSEGILQVLHDEVDAPEALRMMKRKLEKLVSL